MSKSPSSRTSTWEKFLILSWKNWIIQLRHPVQLFFEIFVPIFVCCLLVFIRNKAKIINYPEPLLYEPVDIQTVDQLIFEENLANLEIFYSPKNTFLEEIMKKIPRRLGRETISVYGKENATELADASRNLNPFASVEFDDNWKVRL
jgi:hypothetical protein